MGKKTSVPFVILLIACLGMTAACGGGEKSADDAAATAEAVRTADEAIAGGDVQTPDRPMPDDPEKIREYIAGKMEAMEKKVGDMDARAAEKLALAAAREWDAGARLYQLEGEERLKPEGTAMKWSANFAVREDPEHQRSTERGKKYIVLMMDHKVMSEHVYEGPDKVKHKGPCRSFLPDNRLTAADAYERCFVALAEKHGADADAAAPNRLTCFGRQGYAHWELSMKLNGSPISAQIDSVTGEVLKVK